MNKLEQRRKQIAKQERDWQDKIRTDMLDNAWELKYAVDSKGN